MFVFYEVRLSFGCRVEERFFDDFIVFCFFVAIEAGVEGGVLGFLMSVF
jgi:hypothetical protein